jgi:serine/threonine protein kinase
MSQDQDARLGSTVGGYRIDSVLGRGGMSVVYLAEDAHLGRRVALKFLAPELAQDSKFQERFVRESRLAASLEHPNIVTVYEAREADGQMYLAMRYVAGTDLKRLIADEGALDPERTISIVSQAASALDAAHAEGLIHRDVKPGNILIAPRPHPGGRDRVYLSDFGLTKRATSDSGITATGQFVGTLDYAAPEQFEAKPQDARADVYSLGCVLYECVTGEVPYPRENQAALVYAHLYAPSPKVTTIRPDLPEAVDAVVAKAMAKAPQDRYQSAGELAEAAAQALGVQPVSPTTPTTPIRPVSSARRRRSFLLGSGAAAVALIVLLVILLNGRRGSGSGGPSAAPKAPSTYLARLDPATGELAARIAIGPHPMDVAVGEGSVWVLDKDGSVYRIDPVTNKATVIRGVGQDPTAIAAGEGGVWVADGSKRAVRKIDPASNRVVASMHVSGFAYDVAAGEGGIWVCTGENTARIDPSTGEVTNDIIAQQSGLRLDAVGSGFVWQVGEVELRRYTIATGRVDVFVPGVVPRDVATSEGYLWIASCGTPGTVVRLDARTGEIAATIPAGGGVCPYQATFGNPITIAAVADSVWVTDGANGAVSRIRTVTNAVEAPISVGKTPTAVAVGLGSLWISVDGSARPYGRGANG